MNIDIISKKLGWIAFWFSLLAVSFPIKLVGFFRLELQKVGMQADTWPATWLLGFKMIFLAMILSAVISALIGAFVWVASSITLELIIRLDPNFKKTQADKA